MLAQLLHRSVVFPLFESVVQGRSTLRYLAELERSQWLDAEAMRSLQLERLRTLLAHAETRCPYYESTWRDHGLRAASLTSLDDFVRWPLLTRETIRASREALRAREFGSPLIAKATGGSSGVPLQFDVSEESHERRTAASMRGYAWAGAGVGTRQLYLWGVPLGERSRLARWKDRCYHALHHRRIVSSFTGGDAMLREFLDQLERYRPDAVVAYVNPLYEVARRLDEEGRHAPYAPRSIVVGAEKLHTHQREVIERVFQAPVFETYGSREFMLVGAECERHDGLHLTAEQLLVEVINDDGSPTAPGEVGQVVVTDLCNLGMPFIRYLTGDCAVAGFGTCPCGRGLPLLRSVTGRRLDMLRASGGRLVPGEFFPHLVKDFRAVRRFQVIQETPTLVRFRLQAEGMADEDRLRLERSVREALGGEVAVTFESTAAIELSPAGKLQVVVNRIGVKEAA